MQDFTSIANYRMCQISRYVCNEHLAIASGLYIFVGGDGTISIIVIALSLRTKLILYPPL